MILIDKLGKNDDSTRSVLLETIINRKIRSYNLANSAQARKRARQAEKHRQHNVSLRSNFRTSLKKVIAAIEAGDKEKAAESYKAAVPVIDKLKNKGLITANKAARHKSRLNAHIKALTA